MPKRVIKGVKDSVVSAKLNKNNIVKSIVAFVVLESCYDEKYIKKELTKSLPAYMIPKKIILLDKMPVNKNLKIDRKKLSEYD